MPNCCTEPVYCTNKVYSEAHTFRKQHQMLLKLNRKVPLLQDWKSQPDIKLPILLQSQWLISRCGHKILARADILFPYIAPRPSHQCWNTPLKYPSTPLCLFILAKDKHWAKGQPTLHHLIEHVGRTDYSLCTLCTCKFASAPCTMLSAIFGTSAGFPAVATEAIMLSITSSTFITVICRE